MLEQCNQFYSQINDRLVKLEQQVNDYKMSRDIQKNDCMKMIAGMPQQQPPQMQMFGYGQMPPQQPQGPNMNYGQMPMGAYYNMGGQGSIYGMPPMNPYPSNQPGQNYPYPPQQ